MSTEANYEGEKVLLCIAFNLAKSFKTLYVQEVLIACMSLDGVSAAVFITNSQKEALSSRLYTYICIFCQVFVFVRLGVVMASLPSLPRNPSGFCYPVVWWSVIDACDGPAPRSGGITLSDF